MRQARTGDVLQEIISLKNQRVLDIGCGHGALTRLMAAAGAHVTGLDPSLQQLALARAVPAVAGETYLQGDAENLPFPPGSWDLIVFSNSLHHIAPAAQGAALAEAARLLVQGGVVFVAEPIAEGPFFQITRLIDDETEVRAAALARLREAGRWGFQLETELVIAHQVHFASYQAFCARMCAIDAVRAAAVAQAGPALETAFLQHGRSDPAGGRCFDQPTRIMVLRKTR